MRILVKIGGAGLERAEPRAALCAAIDSARRAGHEILVVHGGGNQIRALCGRLGIEDRYHEGLRITDAETAEVVLMVLGGKVNRELVAALQKSGVKAVGISGADGGSFTAARLEREGVDLGFVGRVAVADPDLVTTLLDAGFVPVIATVAPDGGGTGPFYNLNADHAAGPLCRAFGCDALLFLTDVPGVLDDEGRLLPELSPADCDALVAAGAVRGGMLPKIEAALLALEQNPRALVAIAPASHPDCVLAALACDAGTRFVAASTTSEEHHG